MPTKKKPTSIDRAINTAWDAYLADPSKESQLVTALTRLAKTIAHHRGIHDADDAVQDALLKVWSYKGSYRPAKASFATWAGIVVRQVCNDHKNKLLQQQHSQVPLDTLPKHEFDKQLEDSGWQVEAQERGVAIDEKLKQLSETVREVATLRIKGYTTREIAAELGITCAAAKERWRRALTEIGRG